MSSEGLNNNSGIIAFNSAKMKELASQFTSVANKIAGESGESQVEIIGGILGEINTAVEAIKLAWIDNRGESFGMAERDADLAKIGDNIKNISHNVKTITDAFSAQLDEFSQLKYVKGD